jgi:hypothetical protein
LGSRNDAIVANCRSAFSGLTFKSLLAVCADLAIIGVGSKASSTISAGIKSFFGVEKDKAGQADN